MENDLISRSALKDEILSWCVCITKPSLLSKDDTMYIVENAPAVDAVEVVRCRDCKHGILYYDCAVECRLDETDYAVIREEFDFCSYGVRRGEDGRDK